MFSNDRNQMRRTFADAWRKRNAGQPLEPLEALITDVIALHPEYHALLGDIDSQSEREWFPEDGQTNPFLHMGMHIAIREQVLADRPAGIARVYKQVCDHLRDVHAAEHAMMDCLAEALWQAQRSGSMPDEVAYLVCVEEIIRR
jgi:hypothetical protein